MIEVNEQLYNSITIRLQNVIINAEKVIEKSKEIERMLWTIKEHPEIDNIMDLDRLI